MSYSPSTSDFGDKLHIPSPRLFAWKFRSRKVRIMVLLGITLGLIGCLSYRSDPYKDIVELNDEELMARKGVKSVQDLKFSDRKLDSWVDSPFQIGCREIDSSGARANAAFVVLARNSELEGVIKSMVSLERHFNQWFNYPWVFLNEQEFDDTFKSTVAKYTQGDVEFGNIPVNDWEFPDNIDKDEFNEFVESQGDRKIFYGNKPSYHKMCRYFSGAFFKHELVKKRQWYWRVEPDVEFFCDITYDPFIEMEKHDKKYGFNVMIHELYYTVPGLFRETKAFAKERDIKPNKLWRMMVKNLRYSQGDNDQDYDTVKERHKILQKLEQEVSLKKFLEIKGKKDLSKIDEELVRKLVRQSEEPPGLHEDRFDYEEYNMCHFWSNFEIARTDLFTSDLYSKFFQHLENSGGFYKERWGDAPVHSLALAMMLDIDQVHYFRDIGYKHSTLGHCPSNSKINQLPYTPAPANSNNGNFKSYKPDNPAVNGVGCRCKCPMFHKEIEDSGSSCLKQWFRTTRDDYVPYKPLDLNNHRKKISKKVDKFVNQGGKLGESKVALTFVESKNKN